MTSASIFDRRSAAAAPLLASRDVNAAVNHLEGMKIAIKIGYEGFRFVIGVPPVLIHFSGIVH